MAEQVTLTIEQRTITGKQVRQLRRAGILPANIYGHGRASRAVQVNSLEFRKLLNAQGSNRIIQLALNGAAEPALVRHIEREPKTGKIQHVDFMHVEMNETLRARVTVHLVGEAPAVKTLRGVLLHLLDTVEVECLPTDLPDALEADISGLEELDVPVLVSDIKLPRNVTLLTDGAEQLAKVVATRAEPEPEAAAAAEAAAAPAEGAAELSGSGE
ncbi:MAG TPA: 50S ribosomal protein L25 [Ktedonobacterales bacterium]|nr:50S ribosomal protein L25 [Ktedonobacterales bacterium]